MVWWIVGIVGALIGWKIVTGLVAIITPRRITGRAYLQKRLKYLGFVGTLPDGCIDELVTIADAHPRMLGYMGKGIVKQTAEFTKGLDAMASLVISWRENPDQFFGSLDSYRKIFEKYGI